MYIVHGYLYANLGGEMEKIEGFPCKYLQSLRESVAPDTEGG